MVAVLVAGAVLVAAMRSRASLATPTAPVVGSATVSARDGAFALVQLPGDGLGAVYQLVAQARRAVTLEIYELSDPVMAVELVRAQRRGVHVHVLLSQAYHSRAVNAPAYAYLRRYGLSVRWAPAATIFHIKAMVVDGSVTVVSTGNLVSVDYPTARDAAVIDRDPTQVRAIAATLAADWTDRRFPATAARVRGLLWSPGSGAALVADIQAARRSVLFTSEELADAGVYQALATDARRGVACYVVMTYDRDWRTGLAYLAAAGCHVHVAANRRGRTYFHIKRLIVDPGSPTGAMLLGSQNASFTSLVRNRELSVRLTRAGSPHLLAAATATFWLDYRSASEWNG